MNKSKFMKTPRQVARLLSKRSRLSEKQKDALRRDIDPGFVMSTRKEP